MLPLIDAIPSIRGLRGHPIQRLSNFLLYVESRQGQMSLVIASRCAAARCLLIQVNNCVR
ncbi:hypothetical protein EON00_20245 [Burkholderia sp. ISTR5]|nr:hypothetical protein [Burkholderia sp. ISTR5]